MVKAITHEIVGIKCDDTQCDYEDNKAIFDPEKYLNAPCPKCGANLFTQEDNDSMKKMHRISDFINNLIGEVDDGEEIMNVELLYDGSGSPDVLIKGKKAD